MIKEHQFPKDAFFHLQLTWKLPPDEEQAPVIPAFISCRLHYCNYLCLKLQVKMIPGL